MMKTVKVGFLGCGNIGSGVWQLLMQSGQQMNKTESIRFDVVKVLVRDLEKQRPEGMDPSIFTLDPAEVVENDQIDLVVEFMGGEDPAAAYMIRALSAGKNVVTANKMALSLHWEELIAAARDHSAGLYYEASVCGAIPIISVINDSLQSNRIEKLMGIVNGTTNYILSEMSDKGTGYIEALSAAQALGFAEPDPTSDVEGYDAAYKLSILSSLAFHCPVPFERVYREGITHVTPMDISFGKEFGYEIKLLAIAKMDDKGRVEARVHPTFIPRHHPLASVKGSFNSVFLKGSACDDMMLYGRGAGSLPTASAVVSDMLYACRADLPRYPVYLTERDLDRLMTDWEAAYYVRLSASDRAGVLAHIASRLGDKGVSIRLMTQRGEGGMNGRVPIVLITHHAWESDVKAALDSIDPEAARVESIIRVED